MQMLCARRCSTSRISSARARRIGDVLKFTVEELETPYGDMQLAPERPQERDKFARVWREIRAAMLADEHVMGRVLNAIGGGYSVGVAGIVCFCPISQMDFLTVRA